ncbi:putative quinol monooxygenase [Cognatishimia sp. MH4019]|uniref:putative quinol monooxygenase n=1 Tax=Cognatishimia sp. MH4019 TaxID=2854030 RepID=UPI001CD3EECD|nr:putative quinol monooxygenase [Cognatishimia sp. MH4019]
MFVITVQFKVKPAHLEAFLPLMQANAAQSVAQEEGCHQFDVCQDTDALETVFLYEVYQDEPAFQAHLASAHFRAFDAATADMIASKTVQSYERLS